jgi:hypothetical protein
MMRHIIKHDWLSATLAVSMAALPWMEGPLDSPSHLMLRQLFAQQGLAPNIALRTEDTAALDHRKCERPLGRGTDLGGGVQLSLNAYKLTRIS